jgi:hypothetical protein
LGSKNKSYLDANHWLQRADEELVKEENAEKRAGLIRWAAELIMSKVPALPATPGDSLSNALESHALIKALEHDAANPAPVAEGD